MKIRRLPGVVPSAGEGDMAPATAQLLLAAAAAAPGGTTPAAFLERLRAEGVQTINRVPVSVKTIRQIAGRAQREGLVHVDGDAITAG
jgi:hypothetical protein